MITIMHTGITQSGREYSRSFIEYISTFVRGAVIVNSYGATVGVVDACELMDDALNIRPTFFTNWVDMYTNKYLVPQYVVRITGDTMDPRSIAGFVLVVSNSSGFPRAQRIPPPEILATSL